MLKTLCAALVIGSAAIGSASAASPKALPVSQIASPVADAAIVLAANGCGPGYFRTINGFCEPNARVMVRPGVAVNAGPPCPRGFRRDPDPRRPLCYPIY